jgi:hypothetical protein
MRYLLILLIPLIAFGGVVVFVVWKSRRPGRATLRRSDISSDLESCLAWAPETGRFVLAPLRGEEHVAISRRSFGSGFPPLQVDFRHSPSMQLRVQELLSSLRELGLELSCSESRPGHLRLVGELPTTGEQHRTLVDSSLIALGLREGHAYLYWFDGEFDEREMLQEAYRENRTLRKDRKSVWWMGSEPNGEVDETQVVVPRGCRPPVSRRWRLNNVTRRCR